jgi:Family of unknown function (DUF6448)
MRDIRLLLFTLITGAALLMLPSLAFAHCDGLDGPVVTAARRALDSKNVNHVLIWVKPSAENEIKQAFAQAVAVRSLGPAAKDLADRFFFETLVRVHRAGEGAPYTGLKPAGRNLGPAIPAADKAIETGSVAALEKLLTETTSDGLRDRFAVVGAKRKFPPDDVANGRQYVEAYVGFIHYVESLHEAAQQKAAGHYAEH